MAAKVQHLSHINKILTEIKSRDMSHLKQDF